MKFFFCSFFDMLLILLLLEAGQSRSRIFPAQLLGLASR